MAGIERFNQGDIVYSLVEEPGADDETTVMLHAGHVRQVLEYPGAPTPVVVSVLYDIGPHSGRPLQGRVPESLFTETEMQHLVDRMGLGDGETPLIDTVLDPRYEDAIVFSLGVEACRRSMGSF